MDKYTEVTNKNYEQLQALESGGRDLDRIKRFSISLRTMIAAMFIRKFEEGEPTSITLPVADLPRDFIVLRVYQDLGRMSMCYIIQSQTFPKTEPWGEIPELNMTMVNRSFMVVPQAQVDLLGNPKPPVSNVRVVPKENWADSQSWMNSMVPAASEVREVIKPSRMQFFFDEADSIPKGFFNTPVMNLIAAREWKKRIEELKVSTGLDMGNGKDVSVVCEATVDKDNKITDMKVVDITPIHMCTEEPKIEVQIMNEE